MAGHAPELFALLSDPALYIHLDEDPPASEAWLRERYARLESRASADGRQAWLNWVARDPEGRAVGYVQATVEGDIAWVAYVVGRAFQRHGHATGAMRAMLAYLASAWEVREFAAVVEEDNLPSIRLLERLGFARAPGEERPAQLSETERLYRRRS